MELRHDTIVRGTLAEADDDMNLIMEGASYEPLQVSAPAPVPHSWAATTRGSYAGLQKGMAHDCWPIQTLYKDCTLTRGSLYFFE